MFKVRFGLTDVYVAPNVEAAIAFALEIHRASNVDHVVHVNAPDGREVVSLERVKPQSK